jgi:hypothetical protein
MSNFKEKISEIMQDFGGRIKNPVIATFILVWMYQHWTLIFRLFSTYSNFSVEEKLFLVKIYINHNGFCGMVFCPLLISFGSLFCYYLIAIIAQLIKIVGKFLNSLIAKIDKPGFVPLADLEREEKYSKSLKLQLKQSIEDNKELTYFKEGHEQTHKDLKEEIDAANKNILNNTVFKENIEHTLMILLAKDKDIQQKDLYKDESVINQYNITNGSWDIVVSMVIGEKSGQKISVSFEDSIVKETNGNDYAKIKTFKFYKSSRRLDLALELTKDTRLVIYNLILVNKDELMGFKDSTNYVYFKRT